MLVFWLVCYSVLRICLSYKGTRAYKKKYDMFLIISSVSYLVVLCFITLASREVRSGLHYELSFLWEYRKAFHMKDGMLKIQSFRWLGQIRDNILLFIPVGILTAEWLRGKWKIKWLGMFWVGAAISCIIECTQLITGLGLFEFDDILNNSIGTLVGFAIYKVLMGLCRHAFQR